MNTPDLGCVLSEIDVLPVTAGNVDLTNCDREQIHIPGSIQPHGVLLVVKEADMTVIQVSANVTDILGVPPADLLGHPLSKLMHPTQFRFWGQQMLLKRLDANPLYLVPTILNCSPEYFEGTVHRYDGVLLFQLERFESVEEGRTLDVYASARGMLTELQRTASSAEFFAKTARNVREYTDYDRVVVYKFLEGGVGEVVGESKREDLVSWLGLRYPASDIPKQARELFLRSWLRIIVDVTAVSAEMTPLLNPLTGKLLDMSYCVLRSVSPVHIQYLKNIGAQATMTMSIIKDEKLWGLIACHHHTPKRVPHAARIACELLAHSVSLQVGGKEAAEDLAYLTELRERISEMVGSMATDISSSYHGLVHFEKLLGCFRSAGVGMAADDEVMMLGETPTTEQVRAMLPWLAEQPQKNGVYANDKLSQAYAPAAEFKEKASGLLAIQSQDEHLRWLLWFRPEVIQVIKWAGDPNKPVEVEAQSGLLRLSPRTSFAQWKEENRGASEPWSPGEVEIAAELHAVVNVVLRRAKQLEELNQDLSKSNLELESFAYVASHDLKEPLRGIHNYSHMLVRSLGPKLDAKEAEHFGMVLRLSQRMDELIESLLQYSRVGQTELTTAVIHTDHMVRQLLMMLKTRLDETAATIRMPEILPDVIGDRVRIREVFENLIVNAIKYNDKPEKWVEIGFLDKNPAVFYIRDNGIGIERRYHEAIFHIFRRLHTPEQFGGGTGAGLTITKRIVERHGGRMWMESERGAGSTFYFTLGSGI